MGHSTAHFNECEGRQLPLVRVTGQGQRRGREVLTDSACSGKEVVGGEGGLFWYLLQHPPLYS